MKMIDTLGINHDYVAGLSRAEAVKRARGSRAVERCQPDETLYGELLHRAVSCIVVQQDVFSNRLAELDNCSVMR